MIDRSFALRLRRVDPQSLGAKLRAARISAGLSQGDVAAGEVTISFISRIESGKRRADPELIARIADRLGVDLDLLLNDDIGAEDSPITHQLQFAEVALEMGDATSALTHLQQLPAEPGAMSRGARLRVGVLEARAHEALGDLPRSIGILEDLMQRAPEPQTRIGLSMALSRCYLKVGEPLRAIRIGEEVLDALDDSGLLGGDEAIQLSIAVAAAYFDQGAREYAVRICRRALDAAESSGSPRARGAAYWRVATMELARGDVAAAVTMSQRALTLLAEGRDAHNVALLRSELGQMELRLDPPAVDEAANHLRSARDELDANGATPDERLRNRLALAQVDLLRGDPAGARDDALSIAEDGDSSPGVRAAALMVSGRADLAAGDTDTAREHLLAAGRWLQQISADVPGGVVGQSWMDLAALFESVDLPDAALDAYRRAATASGLAVSAPISAGP